LEGLESTQKTGIRYPIPFFGCQADPMPGMPQKYRDLAEELKK